MSKLEELIQQYCPDGVEYVKLGDIEDQGYIKLGRGNVISKQDMKDCPGDFPVYSSSSVGDGEIGRYGKYMFDDERISWSIDGGGKFFYRNNLRYSITNVSGWLKVLAPKVVSTKYLYYTLMNEWVKKVYDYTHKAHPSVIREEYIIPIPPLPVQEEIVRILDTFTELQAELQAELQKRLQQYNYYRDNLLSFEGRTDVEWKKLGEISKVCRGVRVVKSQLSNEGYPVYQNCLTPMGYYDKTNCPAGTPFVICGGAAGNVGYADVDWWAADDCEYIIGNAGLTNRYIYHCLMAKKDYLLSQVRKASIPRLSPNVIKDLEIPVPPLAEQQRIVDILDRFDSLTNDLTAGLPAEIEKRKQQYEYYRDRLLTFKRKEA